ncbi:hypothetical protein GGR58DRAFT_94517 [Xylaria digitata]|nr:hypothetical protein GGR58DRAFT_94517 [Xylaria digitata]
MSLMMMLLSRPVLSCLATDGFPPHPRLIALNGYNQPERYQFPPRGREVDRGKKIGKPFLGSLVLFDLKLQIPCIHNPYCITPPFFALLRTYREEPHFLARGTAIRVALLVADSQLGHSHHSERRLSE